jgi:hypothetical protein
VSVEFVPSVHLDLVPAESRSRLALIGSARESDGENGPTRESTRVCNCLRHYFTL